MHDEYNSEQPRPYGMLYVIKRNEAFLSTKDVTKMLNAHIKTLIIALLLKLIRKTSL